MNTLISFIMNMFSISEIKLLYYNNHPEIIMKNVSLKNTLIFKHLSVFYNTEHNISNEKLMLYL